MYGLERNSLFCFPKSPGVTGDKVEGNSRTWGKTKLISFPRDHTLSAVLSIYYRLYLKQSFGKNREKKRAKLLYSHMHGQQLRNCILVGIHSNLITAYDQESTNYSDHFVDWKSRYITMESDLVLFANLFELTWMICVGGSCPRPYASAASLPWDLDQAITDMDQ